MAESAIFDPQYLSTTAGHAVSELFQHLWRETRRSVEGNTVVVTLPFLDRHNDYLQVYLTYRNTETWKWRISDDGYTIHELELQNRQLSPEFAHMRDGSELALECTERGTGPAFWRLLRAMMSV